MYDIFFLCVTGFFWLAERTFFFFLSAVIVSFFVGTSTLAGFIYFLKITHTVPPQKLNGPPIKHELCGKRKTAKMQPSPSVFSFSSSHREWKYWKTEKGKEGNTNDARETKMMVVYIGSACMYEGRYLLFFWGGFGQFSKKILAQQKLLNKNPASAVYPISYQKKNHAQLT